MASLEEVAQEVGMDVDAVRVILAEVPGHNYDKATLDRVFGAARKLGYDLKKLKIGKRMEVRKAAIEDIIKQVETHADWTRDDILEYMRHSIGLVRRVQKKAFPAEFPTEE